MSIAAFKFLGNKIRLENAGVKKYLLLEDMAKH
jgi:hypothetical protein